jgi:hypothetical protein
MRRALSVVVLLAATAARAQAQDDAAKYLQFVEEHAASCVTRNGTQIQVKNTHATRKIRVWLDRYHMGVGTGDRSRSELAHGAEPEPLGCSRSDTGRQEWRVVRVIFVD